MYLGLIETDGKILKLVNINANDEKVAKNKLIAYVNTLNNKKITGTFIDTDKLQTITRLFYI